MHLLPRKILSSRSIRLILIGLITLSSILLAFVLPTTSIQGAPDHAKNIILFIGDGMGDSEITIARNYYVGANGRLSMDTLPMTGAYTTYAVQEGNPSLPEYVTDSSASGTGWATGVKTSNGRVSTTAGTDQDLKTILEWAQEAGYRTGDVSTAELTDATPAVLASHVNSRGCQGPADMGACPQDKKSAGGPGSIAEQQVDHHVDVLLGGGRDRFAQTIDGGPYINKTVIESAQIQGYTVVSNSTQLQQVLTGKRVLGLFTGGVMSQEWTGQIASADPGTPAQRCVENQRPSNEPSLSAMTQKALQLLDIPAISPIQRGFFLQVEGASIDKRDHAADPCGQIGETVAFDRAIQVGLTYASTHPDTLVIVTADHGQTSQIIPLGAHSPGMAATLITNEGVQMKIGYATNFPNQTQEHTGTEVRIAAQGPNSQRVLGITNQTDLFYTMAEALGVGSARPTR